MITRTVERGDVSLSVIERGPSTAPVIVLVHGYPDSQVVCKRVAEVLAARFRVVTYDVRGAGRSTAPASVGGYALPVLAGDLEAVIDAVSPGVPVHVVGHDWGSIQTWESVTEPAIAAKLRSFTSISGPCLDHIGYWLRSRPRVRPLVSQLRRSWYIGAMHGLAPVPSVWAALIARAIPRILPAGARDPELELTRRSDARNGIKLYVANIGPRLAAPRMRTTEVPVQLIVPTDDAHATPALVENVGQFVSTLVRRDVTGGHWGLFAEPARTAGWIAGFVDYVEGTRSDPTLDRYRA
jgi:pimeloyl-ACP methyl ester carboxylesterase